MMQSRKSSGFTLIEMGVALAILTVILSFVYTTFFGTLKAKDIVDAKNDTIQTGRMILQRLTRDLNAAVLTDFDSEKGDEESLKTIFWGIRDEEDGRELDKLHFTTLSHTEIPIEPEDNNQSALAEVSYLWEKDYEEDRIYLFRREDYLFDSELTEGGVYSMIASGIREFRLRYYARNDTGYEWVEDWDSTSRNALPTAVEVYLALEEEDGDEEVFTALIPLFLVGENGS